MPLTVGRPIAEHEGTSMQPTQPLVVAAGEDCELLSDSAAGAPGRAQAEQAA